MARNGQVCHAARSRHVTHVHMAACLVAASGAIRRARIALADVIDARTTFGTHCTTVNRRAKRIHRRIAIAFGCRLVGAHEIGGTAIFVVERAIDVRSRVKVTRRQRCVNVRARDHDGPRQKQVHTVAIVENGLAQRHIAIGARARIAHTRLGRGVAVAIVGALIGAHGRFTRTRIARAIAQHERNGAIDARFVDRVARIVVMHAVDHAIGEKIALRQASGNRAAIDQHGIVGAIAHGHVALVIGMFARIAMAFVCRCIAVAAMRTQASAIHIDAMRITLATITRGYTRAIVANTLVRLVIAMTVVGALFRAIHGRARRIVAIAQWRRRNRSIETRDGRRGTIVAVGGVVDDGAGQDVAMRQVRFQRRARNVQEARLGAIVG
jgi:hypothetical protein